MGIGIWQHAFVINLPHRSDRRTEMRREFSRVGIDDPQAEGIEFFEAHRPASAGAFPSIGAHGCFMSHLAVLRHARERGLPNVLIFEDDLAFTDDFTRQIGPVSRALESQPWQLFYGGYDHVGPPPVMQSPVSRIDVSVEIRCCHFMVLGRDAIDRAVPFLEAMLHRPAGDPAGGPMHVDGAYNWFRKLHPDFPCLLANPPLGVQRSSRSDIAELKWFDRVPVARQLASAARRALRS